ncbi:MAG: hypothetical protein JWO90_1186 [Solirubrobacterales bacterium]|nr:hypothetical protein [Solirubrobacterales bacterium]
MTSTIASASTTRRPSPRDLLRHPLFWVLLASTAIRTYTVAGVSVSLGYSDSTAYVRMADGQEGAGISPPGYALFLRALHGISDSVDLVLVVQHLLVLVAGVAVYGMARELGCRRGTSTVAAGVLVLCGNLLSTPQGLLTETLFVCLVTLAAWGAARAGRSGRWQDLAMLGAFAGLATTVRAVGLPLLLVLGFCLVLGAASWKARGVRIATMGASAALVVVVVALVSGSTAGLPGAGPTSSGWLLYGRVAQFADCPATYVDRDLRDLCPGTTREDQRAGPDYWRVIDGPAVKRFGGIPKGDAELQEFAVAAILHEPLAYLRTVFVDTMRFFSPNFGQERGYSGAGWDELELDRPLDPAAAAYNNGVIASWFADGSTRTSGLGLVRRYQEATTLTAGTWSVLAIFAILAPLLARGRRRWKGLMLLLGAGSLLISATALNMYVARYALPALGLLLPVAALGFEALARRTTGVPEPADGLEVRGGVTDAPLTERDGLREEPIVPADTVTGSVQR